MELHFMLMLMWMSLCRSMQKREFLKAVEYTIKALELGKKLIFIAFTVTMIYA